MGKTLFANILTVDLTEICPKYSLWEIPAGSPFDPCIYKIFLEWILRARFYLLGSVYIQSVSKVEETSP